MEDINWKGNRHILPFGIIRYHVQHKIYTLMLHPQERGLGGTLIFLIYVSLTDFLGGLGGVKILNFSIFFILPLNWTLFRVILGIFKVKVQDGNFLGVC